MITPPPRLRRGLADRGAEPLAGHLEPVHDRNLHVHQDHVRLQIPGLADRLSAVSSLTHHLQARLGGEYGGEAVSYQRLMSTLPMTLRDFDGMLVMPPSSEPARTRRSAHRSLKLADKLIVDQCAGQECSEHGGTHPRVPSAWQVLLV